MRVMVVIGSLGFYSQGLRSAASAAARRRTSGRCTSGPGHWGCLRAEDAASLLQYATISLLWYIIKYDVDYLCSPTTKE